MPDEAYDPVEVVGFGMLTPCVVLAVDRLPKQNDGELIQAWGEFIYDDAAIVATLLRDWSVSTGLIGTALGDDQRGRDVVSRLKALGVQGEIRLEPDIHTPLEVEIADPSGARTYFWERKPAVLDTLASADLSLVAGAQWLYVDWYDGDHILRAMDEARRLGVDVFLNLEYGHQQPELLERYARRATICQAVTGVIQSEGDPVQVAEALLGAGVTTALVTLGGEGCVVAQNDLSLRVRAPQVSVVDGAAAGATLSAGFIYGHLRGWSLEDSIRFATAAASLKCTVVGPRAFPLQDVHSVAKSIEVEQLDVKSSQS